MEKTKICNVCGIEKPLTEFTKRPTYKDGYSKMCKDCYAKQWKEKYGAEYKAMRRKRFMKSPLFAFAYIGYRVLYEKYNGNVTYDIVNQYVSTTKTGVDKAIEILEEYRKMTESVKDLAESLEIKGGTE